MPTPPRPFAQARVCPSDGVGVEPQCSGFFEPLLFAVLNAGLGVRDALVEGQRGPFVSVLVQSVHHNTSYHTSQRDVVCLEVMLGHG